MERMYIKRKGLYMQPAWHYQGFKNAQEVTKEIFSQAEHSGVVTGKIQSILIEPLTETMRIHIKDRNNEETRMVKKDEWVFLSNGMVCTAGHSYMSYNYEPVYEDDEEHWIETVRGKGQR